MAPPSWQQTAEQISHRMEVGEPVHLCFDFDGTVADYQIDPLDSRPNPIALDAYTRLSELPGVNVSVITGRWLAFADPLFPASIDLYCSYGIEGRREGQHWVHPDLAHWTPKIRSFWDHLIEKATVLGIAFAFNAPTAQAHDAIYIESKPAGFGLHDAPARHGNPQSSIPEAITRLVDSFDGDFDGLKSHVNNGNVEFSATIADENGRAIDKKSVIDSFDGYVIFSGDDTGDITAARAVDERDGIVLVIDHKSDGLRRGSPAELVSMADVTFDTVDEHAAFISEVARYLLD